MTAMKVTTADFIKNYGRLADKALTEPVTITKNGHDRLVVLAVEEYERLKRRDRRVLRAGELNDEEIVLIAEAEVPAEHAHLDDELKDWRP
jgi:PHD/YefM family antitoxin component YafN of YafNO toxin-antitoxin module